jgi:PAS domain S-box-containing protein
LTTRPRLLIAPALLAVAAAVVLAVALLSEPGEPALVLGLTVAAALVLLAAVVAVWSARELAADLETARDAAGASAGLLEDLFDSATSTVLVATDAAGAITRFNPGAESVIGVPAASATGRSPAFFLDEAELASWALAMRCEPDFATVAAGLLESGQQQPFEWPFRRPDGERRVLDLSISPIRSGRGDLTGYLLAGRDVTDQVGDSSGTEHFLATMSLELRAPMASILGYAEMLQEELEEQQDTSGARGFVDRIERNGQRMLMLIQDLLMLTRVEDPELGLQREEIDLRTLVTTAYDDLLVRVSDRKLDVSLRLPPDPVHQECDRKLLEHVVQHLLANAVKFTPDGGRIVVSAKTSGTVNRIVVGDTGLGISQTDRERLFTRFFRSHQAEVQQLQGSGLGLAIVRAVCEAHGGTVSVETELGRGSTFVVELPRRLAGSAAEQVEAAEAPSSMSA